MSDKVVVANSVGKDSYGYYLVHSPSRWSVGWKGYREVFTYYPWELAYLSSLLKSCTSHKILLMDGCLNKWDVSEYYKAISPHKPDWLIMESSSRSFEEDIKLALRVKEAFGTRLIFCGQHPTAFPEEASSLVDFVCVGEYEKAVLEILSGNTTTKILPRTPLLDFNSLPFPEDSDVKRIDYAVPGEPNCEYKEIQIYASRGCPFSCRFCVCSNIYYNKPNWRPREIASIISEIQMLLKKYPEVEGFFFDEELHNGNKAFVMELTDAIVSHGLNSLKYNAMCAYWNMDKEMLQAMKKAGYYKIRIGIETGSEKTALGLNLGKKHSLKKLYDVLGWAKDVGLKVYGTFTVGGEGSTKKEDLVTGNLIKKLVSEGLLNDIQVSINTPQPGTPFFQEAKKNGWLLTEDWKKYDGGHFAVVNYPWYSSKEIEKTYQNVLSSYDKGLYVRNKSLFIENFRKTSFITVRSLSRSQYSYLAKDNLERVLIGRSARMWHVRLIIEALRLHKPAASLDILIQEDMESISGIRKAYCYGSGFFSFESMSKKLLRRLEDEKYTAILIPCNNFRQDGYSEWEKLANALGTGVIVFPDGTNSLMAVPSDY